MEKYKLLIPISSNSNMVISEEVEIGEYFFKPEVSHSYNKGIIETKASNKFEAHQKFKEIKDFTAFFSLIKSKELNSDFFIYPGELQFFVETYGISQDGKKINLFMSVGKEETCITKNFIKENFKEYQKISQKEEILRSLRWYQSGKIALDDADAIISFITSLEATCEEKKRDDYFREELNRVIAQIRNTEVSEGTKQKCLNAIKNLKNISFKEKMENLTRKISKDTLTKLKNEARKRNLIDSNKEITDLLGDIYKKRSKILHRGEKEVKNAKQIREWLELFVKEILFFDIINSSQIPTQ